FAEGYGAFRTMLERGEIQIENVAQNTKLIARHESLIPGQTVEKVIELTWEANRDLEFIYHHLGTDEASENFLRVSLEAISEAGVYGTSRGNFVSNQVHISHSYGPRTLDGLDPEVSFTPTIRALRAFNNEDWLLVREAFPPAKQRHVFIAPLRNKELSGTPTQAVMERAALEELHSTNWDKNPGETDRQHFIRVATRVARLSERHYSQDNTDGLISVMARRMEAEYEPIDLLERQLREIETELRRMPKRSRVPGKEEERTRLTEAKREIEQQLDDLRRNVEPITPSDREALQELTHLSPADNPPPTYEVREWDTAEEMKVIGPDGQPRLVLDPKATLFQQRMIVSRFYRAANSPDPLPLVVARKK
ncbi:MAG: hypothetical protein Q7S00_00195, partial [bacterium]|nr:hypothetical protein [bacterium]